MHDESLAQRGGWDEIDGWVVPRGGETCFPVARSALCAGFTHSNVFWISIGRSQSGIVSRNMSEL